MPLPNISVNYLQGGFDRLRPEKTGILGFICTGVAVVGGVQLNTPYKITSLEQVAALLITPAYDTANDSNLYKHLSDIFFENSKATVWLMVVAANTTQTQMLAPSGTIAPALLLAAQGDIHILGTSRSPAVAPTFDAAVTDIDPDVTAAIPEAQGLAAAQRAINKPIVVMIEGREYTSDDAQLPSLRGLTASSVSVVLGTNQTNGRAANIGEALGRLSLNPVQRNIMRDFEDNLKSLRYDNYYLGTGANNQLEKFNETQLGAIYDKGYIFPRKLPEKTGNFWADDPTAVSLSDSYAFLSAMRTQQKIHRLCIQYYADFFNTDVLLDPVSGLLAANTVKAFESGLQQFLETNVQALTTLYTNNVSGLKVLIDPNQDVQTTQKLVTEVRWVQRGQIKSFDIGLGITKTLNV